MRSQRADEARQKNLERLEELKRDAQEVQHRGICLPHGWTKGKSALEMHQEEGQRLRKQALNAAKRLSGESVPEYDVNSFYKMG